MRHLATPLAGLLFGFVAACALLGFFFWKLNEGTGREAADHDSKPAGQSADTALVRGLLAENLEERRFSFATVIEATADRKVLTLDTANPAHQRVTEAIDEVLEHAVTTLSAPDSPIRGLRRINEGSRFFEEALKDGINGIDGLRCEIPTNRQGEHQRSGYPDLKVIDEKSGSVFYLDPKLVEESSWKSTFRSFYFEPKTKTLKVNDDAVHLLIGIAHDGRDGAWTFGRWKLIDLSTLDVRLKAEFQASNRDLYGAD